MLLFNMMITSNCPHLIQILCAHNMISEEERDTFKKQKYIKNSQTAQILYPKNSIPVAIWAFYTDLGCLPVSVKTSQRRPLCSS